MKLKKYIENLQKFADENPESLNMDIVVHTGYDNHSSDIQYPTLGILDFGEFVAEKYFDEDDIPNTVCIN